MPEHVLVLPLLSAGPVEQVPAFWELNGSVLAEHGWSRPDEQGGPLARQLAALDSCASMVVLRSESKRTADLSSTAHVVVRLPELEAVTQSAWLHSAVGGDWSAPGSEAGNEGGADLARAVTAWAVTSGARSLTVRTETSGATGSGPALEELLGLPAGALRRPEEPPTGVLSASELALLDRVHVDLEEHDLARRPWSTLLGRGAVPELLALAPRVRTDLTSDGSVQVERFLEELERALGADGITVRRPPDDARLAAHASPGEVSLESAVAAAVGILRRAGRLGGAAEAEPRTTGGAGRPVHRTRTRTLLRVLFSRLLRRAKHGGTTS